MPRGPMWTIFIMMSASIVTAAIYHTYDLVQRGESFSRHAFTWRPSTRNPAAQVENDCKSERLYFEGAFARLAPIYRETRWRRNQDFHSSCVTAGLLNTDRIAPGVRHHWCNEKGLTEVPAPCVSATLSNVVDNAIGDIVDCFGIPSREFLAVAAQRALLPLNAQTKVGFVPIDSERLEQSDKTSCQRVNHLAKLEVGGETMAGQAACSGLRQPFISLIQLGFSLSDFQEEFERQWKETDFRMEQTGFEVTQRQQLRAWAYFLSVENGVDSAAVLTDGFLRALSEDPAARGRSLSSLKSPVEINIRQDLMSFLKTKLDKANFSAVERTHNWFEVANPLKAQCAPEGI